MTWKTVYPKRSKRKLGSERRILIEKERNPAFCLDSGRAGTGAAEKSGSTLMRFVKGRLFNLLGHSKVLLGRKLMLKPNKYLIVVFLLLCCLLTACGKEEAVVKESAIAVETATAQVNDISQVIHISGQIIPQLEVNVLPHIPGFVKSIEVAVGDRVKEGQLLFSIENGDLAASLSQAQAAYQVAKSANDNAGTNYNRMKALYDEGAISLSQLEQAKVAMDSTNPAAAAAAVQAVRVQYENTYNKAPIAGQVASCDLVLGGLASQQAVAVRIVDIAKVKMKGSVSESQIGSIKIGQTVQITIQSASAEPFAGTVTTVAPAADSMTMTFPIEITIDNAQNKIKAGMFGEVVLPVQTHKDVVVIPNSAIVTQDDQKQVFVVESTQDGLVCRLVKIETGLESDDMVEIISGIASGDKVVTKGQNQLQDGMSVQETNGLADANTAKNLS